MPFPPQTGQRFDGINKSFPEHFSPVSRRLRIPRAPTFPALRFLFPSLQFLPRLNIKFLQNLNIKQTKTNPHYFLPFSCAAGADRAFPRGDHKSPGTRSLSRGDLE